MAKSLSLFGLQQQLGKALLTLEADQARWSQETFGSDTVRGPEGSLKHLLKEVQEALDYPDDIIEYADCLSLLMDAARRAGFSISQVIKAADAKLQVNKDRVWNESVTGESVEHVRSDEISDEIIAGKRDKIRLEDMTPRDVIEAEAERNRRRPGTGYSCMFGCHEIEQGAQAICRWLALWGDNSWETSFTLQQLRDVFAISNNEWEETLEHYHDGAGEVCRLFDWLDFDGTVDPVDWQTPMPYTVKPDFIARATRQSIPIPETESTT